MPSLKPWRKQAQIEERQAAHTPTPLKHCVVKVAAKHGGDTSRAFAICTASMQKAGVLKKGTKTLTAKGKGKATAHANEPDADSTLGDYEKLLAANRKNEAAVLDRAKRLAGIGEGKRPRAGDWMPPPSGGMKDAPIGTVRHLARSYEGGQKKHAWIKTSHEGWRGWKYLGKAARHPEHTPSKDEALSPDVARFLADGPERFWELAGLAEGPHLASWELPEWANGNERPAEAEAASWKLAVVKDPPRPGKGHLYSPEEGQHDAYQSLGQALAALKLPTSEGESRKVDPKEFVYRGQHTSDGGKTSWVHFRHRDTRNNVHLDLDGKLVVIPKNSAPFQRGAFDKVEHADVLVRLRSLAGIE